MSHGASSQMYVLQLLQWQRKIDEDWLQRYSDTYSYMVSRWSERDVSQLNGALKSTPTFRVRTSCENHQVESGRKVVASSCA